LYNNTTIEKIKFELFRSAYHIVHMSMYIDENHWLVCLSAGKCLSLFPTKIIIARLTNILVIQIPITILDDHTASLSRATIIITTLNIHTHTLEYYIAYWFYWLTREEKKSMDATKDEFNIPNIIIDPRTRTQYSKGKFLGKVSSFFFVFIFIQIIVFVFC